MCYKDASFWHTPELHDNDVAEVLIQHTSAYVSIRQHTSYA